MSVSAVLLAVAAFLLSGTAARAFVVTLDLEKLKDENGVALPVSGLLVLTAGTDGAFPGPVPESFASGGEIVLQKWDLAAFSMPGVFSDLTADIHLSGNFNSGDPLRIYWYPTLTLNSAAPGAGTSFGTYRDSVGIDGSAAWLTPSSGSNIALKFFTDDATFLSTGGSNPAAAGRATLHVIPEPAPVTLALFAAAWFGFARCRRVEL